MTNERFQIIKAKLEQIDRAKEKLQGVLASENPFGMRGGIEVTINGNTVTRLLSPEKLDEICSIAVTSVESHLTKLQKEFEKL